MKPNGDLETIRLICEILQNDEEKKRQIRMIVLEYLMERITKLKPHGHFIIHKHKGTIEKVVDTKTKKEIYFDEVEE